MPTMPLGVNGVKANNSVLGTFNTLLTEASKEIQKPQQLSEQMMKGEREFNAADLMVSMLEAEKKLNVTVRVINDIVKGIKQLEQIQV
jgi:flagellar hook-basal body complex protein FliE